MSTSRVRDIIDRGNPFNVAGHVGLVLGDERVSIMRIGQVKGQVWYAKDFETQYRDWETDRKSTRLNSSHSGEARMPSSA